MKRLVILLVFVCSFARAEWSDWDDKDKALLVTSTALLAADWLQTREIAEDRHGYRFYERNPILGRHPSMSAVNWYMGSWVVGNYFIADWLGPNHRWMWLGAVTAVELRAVRGNYRLGVRVGF